MQAVKARKEYAHPVTVQSKINTLFTKVRCPVRLSKRDVVFQNCSEILADISIVLFYEKLLDDEFDEKAICSNSKPVKGLKGETQCPLSSWSRSLGF